VNGYHPTVRVAVVRAGVLVAAGAGVLSWAVAPAPITGRVLDRAGHPISQATVTATSLPLGRSTTAPTDSSGAYHLLGFLWPADRSVTVTAPGFRAERTAGGRVVLHRWPWISGTVTDDGGDVVEGATVTVSHTGSAWRGTSDESGRFGFTAELGSGPAVFTAAAPDHDRAARRVTLGMDHEVAVAPVLMRHVGFLNLDSDPSGVPPLIDGRVVRDCPGTPCQATLIIGHHLVSVGGDYLPWSQDVVVALGRAIALQLQVSRKTGTLSVGAPGGELFVDGRRVALGAWSGTVPTGHHTVTFRSAATWPLFAAADVGWNQTAEISVQPHPVVPGDAGAFTSELQAYLSGRGGSYGVWVQELGSGRTLALGQDTLLEAASVIKVPEALYLLHLVDAGTVKLSDEVTLQAGDFMSGTGILYAKAHPGDQYPYQDLLADLIRYSDNTAWRAILRTLGMSSIDSYAASLGAGACHQWADGCTARQAGSLLVQLALGRVLSAGSTQLLLGLLQSTVFNDRINYYLPGVAVAHKVGMDGGVINDCGIVYAPGSPFVVCVFTTTNDPNMGVQVIRDITRAAYHYLGH
jgi:beta-lactamase class A